MSRRALAPVCVIRTGASAEWHTDKEVREMIAEKTGGDEVQADGFLAMLPHIWGRHDCYPSDMIGAAIVRFGTIPSQRDEHGGRIEGGGLVLEYRPHGSRETKRIMFAFNDEGMWVSSSSSLGSGNGGSGVSSTSVVEESSGVPAAELIENSSWTMPVELAMREISNDDLSKTIHGWSGYLPSRIEEKWEEMSLQQRAVALVMAEDRYNRDYGLDE